MGWGDGDLPQLGYWEAGVGEGDKVGWDNEMGEGDRDRAEGGLSAEAESSENLRAEGDRASIKVFISIRENMRAGMELAMNVNNNNNNNKGTCVCSGASGCSSSLCSSAAACCSAR